MDIKKISIAAAVLGSAVLAGCGGGAAGTADNTTRTEGARKSGGLTYNPSSSRLEVTTPNSGSTIITGLSVSVSGILHGGCNVTMTGDDITIASSGNTQTWDGTNTSLRDAITALSNRISALGG